MRKSTRRDVLVLSAATVAGVGIAAAAGKAARGDDDKAHAACDRFWAAVRAHQEAHHAWDAKAEEVRARPDCPDWPLDTAAKDHQYQALMKAAGVDVLCEASNETHQAMGEALRAVFATPAVTPAGAARKVAVLQRIYQGGYYYEPDHDLTCFEEDGSRAAWFESTVAELRSIGRAS